MRYLYTIKLVCFVLLSSLAQDPQFSQPYATPLYLNPAFAGYAEGFRANVGHRIQWRDLGRYTTSTASADIPYECGPIRMGAGLLLMTDKQQADVTTLTGGIMLVPPMLKTQALSLRGGIYLGGGQRTYSRSGLTFMDQLSAQGVIPTSQDPLAMGSLSKTFLDVGAGALFDFDYVEDWKGWIGVSVYHLNQPDISVSKEAYRLPARWSLHTGSRLNMGSWSLSPVANLRKQTTLYQLDAGAYINYYPFVAGLFYRGIPLSKSLVRLNTQDAVVALVGIEHNDFSFGFSYDITVSKLGGYTGNTVEFTLRYSRFDWWWGCDDDARKRRENARSFDCPVPR